MQELHEKASAGNGPRMDKAPTLAAATNARVRKLRREIASAACFVIRSTICRSSSVAVATQLAISIGTRLVRLAKESTPIRRSESHLARQAPASLSAPGVVSATVTGPTIDREIVPAVTATIAGRTLAGTVIARAAKLPAVRSTRTATCSCA